MNNLIIASTDRSQMNSWLAVLSPQYSVTFAADIGIVFSEERQFKKDSLLILDAGLIDKKYQLPVICQHIKKVIVVGEGFTPSQQIQFIYEGASGYCDKSIDKQLIVRAIKAVLNNEVWIKREFVPQMLKGIVAKQRLLKKEKSFEKEALKTISILTQREIEVVEYVYNGEENTSIAEKLNITTRTVKAHMSAIFRKLNVQGRCQLVVFLKDLQVGNHSGNDQQI
ncbi:MAG: DNA-binding response regulator [Methylococcaceae bacterium]